MEPANSQVTAKSAPRRVMCRPSVEQRIFVGFLAAFGVWALVPGIVSHDKALLRIGLALLAAAAVCAILCAMVWIVADDSGLRYRRWLVWHSALWSDVLDFYESEGSRSEARYCRSVIVTRGHTLSLVYNLWSNIDVLRAIVARNATSAKAREWGRLGARVQDTESVLFRYRAYDVYALWIVMFGYAAVWIFRPFSKGGFSFTSWSVGWQWTVFEIVLVLSLPVAVLIGFVFSYRSFKKSRERLIESIETTIEGIAFTRGDTRIFSRWEEIQGYGCVEGKERGDSAYKYQVRTPHGEIEFWYTLRHDELLKTIISQRAPAGCGDWNLDFGNVLGDRAKRIEQLPNGGTRHRFDWWNRSTRLWLWGLAGAGYLFVILSLVLPLTDDSKFQPSVACIGLLLLVATYWVRHRLKSLHVGVYTMDEGIGSNGFFRSKFIPWREVESVVWPSPGNPYCTVVGKSGKIRFLSGINYFAELRAEVEGRVHVAG